MAFVVTCPACSSRLKTPQLVAAGTLVACPSCNHQFNLKQDSPELDASPASPPVPPPIPTKAKRKTTVEADFEEDDHEDERPKNKKKRVVVEEDDEEEVPAKRTKTTSGRQKKSKLVIIAAVALPFLFLACGGIGYGIYSYAFGGGPSSDMLAWAPTDSTSISGIRYARISEIGNYRSRLEARVRGITFLGVKEGDIDEIMIAKTGAREMQVVRTKSKIDVGALAQASNAKETKSGEYTYYATPGTRFFSPSSRLLVICFDDTAMNAVLTKDRKVTIDKELRNVLGKTSGDLWDASINKNQWVNGNLGGSGVKAHYGGSWLGESQIRSVHYWIFTDEESAKRSENSFDTVAKLMKAGSVPGKKIDTFELTRSGNVITLNVVITGDQRDLSFLGGL